MILWAESRQRTAARIGSVDEMSPADALKVGYLPVTGHAKFYVAKEQGLFAKEGLAPAIVSDRSDPRLDTSAGML